MHKMGGWAHLLITTCLLAICLAIAIYLGLRAIPEPDQKFESVIKVIELAVLGCGLLSVILLAEQIRLTEYRAKMVAFHKYFHTLPRKIHQAPFVEITERYGFQKNFEEGGVLTHDVISQLVQTAADARSLRGYLDDFEELCGAVNCGVVSEKYALSLEGARVIRTYVVFMPFIRECRKTNPLLPTAYKQIEVLGDKWHKEREKRKLKIQKDIDKATK